MPEAWNINENTTDPSHRSEAEHGRANTDPGADQDATSTDETGADDRSK